MLTFDPFVLPIIYYATVLRSRRRSRMNGVDSAELSRSSEPAVLRVPRADLVLVDFKGGPRAALI